MRDQILERAEAMYLRYGIRSVTMDDIAGELGISKKTLYQYVDNKADLINQVVDAHIRLETEEMRKIREASSDAVEEMVNMAKYVIHLFRQMGPTIVYDLKKYYRESWGLLEEFHMEHIYLVIRQNIEKGIKQGLYRPDLSPDILAKIYVGNAMILIDEELFPIHNYKRDALFKEYIDYHIRGIATKKGLTLLNTYQQTEKT